MSDDDQSDKDLHERSDEPFASDIQDFHSLLRTGDGDGVIAALENPEFYRLTCDDPRYGEIAMQGIAVLAWLVPAQASEFLVRFDSERSRQDPKSSARRAARALMAALEWRQLEAEPDSPLASAELLRNFLRLYPALAEDGAHATRLREDLRDRPTIYADLFEYLHKRAQVLPRWIFTLGGESVTSASESDLASEPAAPPELSDRRKIDYPSRLRSISSGASLFVAQSVTGPAQRPLRASPTERLTSESDQFISRRSLSDAQRLALKGTLAELRTVLRSRVTQYLVWVIAAALVVALPTALGALFGLLLVGASFALGERRAYETIVRPRLIHLAIEHGVGAQHVVSFIYSLSAEAGKVGNFDIKIENDHALDLLAALSSALGIEDSAGESS